MARLVIETADRRKIYEILEDRVTVGSDAENEVRLPEGIGGRQCLLLTRDGDSYRIAALRSAATIRINGDDLTEQTLRHGDRIEVDGTVLLFLDESQEAAAQEEAPPETPPLSTADLANAAAQQLGARPRTGARARTTPSASGRQRDRPRRRSGRDPRTLPMTSALVCLIAAAAYYLVKTSPGGFSRSPESLLSLAKHQAQQGHLDRALGTLESALQMTPSGATRTAIEQQIDTIQATLRRRLDQGTLSNAATGFRNLQQFESAYLERTPTHRPACREIVRKIDAWLASYSTVCRQYEDEAVMIADTQAMRTRYAPAARLTEPDTAEDVMFVARSKVRVRGKRRYREAVETLDAFLERAPGDAQAGEVRQMRDDLVPEGESWLARALRQVEKMIAAEMLDDARRQLDFLTEQALPEWGDQIEPIRAELDRAAR